MFMNRAEIVLYVSVSYTRVHVYLLLWRPSWTPSCINRKQIQNGNHNKHYGILQFEMSDCNVYAGDINSYLPKIDYPIGSSPIEIADQVLMLSS